MIHNRCPAAPRNLGWSADGFGNASPIPATHQRSSGCRSVEVAGGTCMPCCRFSRFRGKCAHELRGARTLGWSPFSSLPMAVWDCVRGWSQSCASVPGWVGGSLVVPGVAVAVVLMGRGVAGPHHLLGLMPSRGREWALSLLLHRPRSILRHSSLPSNHGGPVPLQLGGLRCGSFFCVMWVGDTGKDVCVLRE